MIQGRQRIQTRISPRNNSKVCALALRLEWMSQRKRQQWKRQQNCCSILEKEPLCRNFNTTKKNYNKLTLKKRTVPRPRLARVSPKKRGQDYNGMLLKRTTKLSKIRKSYAGWDHQRRNNKVTVRNYLKRQQIVRDLKEED